MVPSKTVVMESDMIVKLSAGVRHLGLGIAGMLLGLVLGLPVMT